MPSVIEEIREKMAKYPQVHVEYDESSATYSPETRDGFIVRLVVKKTPRGERYIIYYNGSRENTSSPRWAVTLFAFGLSTGCRLQEYSRSGIAYRWIVETWDKKTNRWDADWDVVDYFAAALRFWQRPTICCLQNHLIDLESDIIAQST